MLCGRCLGCDIHVGFGLPLEPGVFYIDEDRGGDLTTVALLLCEFCEEHMQALRDADLVFNYAVFANAVEVASAEQEAAIDYAKPGDPNPRDFVTIYRYLYVTGSRVAAAEA